MIIKKLDILSVGKITGIIAAAFGLIAGLLQPGTGTGLHPLIYRTPAEPAGQQQQQDRQQWR